MTLKIKHKKLIKECTDSKIYIISEVQGRNYIVKELLTQDRIKSMNKEIKICQKIKDFFPDFPCPVPRRTERPNIFIQDYIEGRPYLELQLDIKQKREIARQIIELLDLFESIEINDRERLSGQQWIKEISFQFEERINKIKNSHIVKDSVLEKINLWTRTQILTLSTPEKMVYVHNDLNKENILIDIATNNIKVSIIDFERTLIADPLKEISKMIWLFRADGEFGDIFWEQYTAQRGIQNKILLKVYWIFDILKHLENYHEMKKLDGWNRYLTEEIEILDQVTEENYKLW